MAKKIKAKPRLIPALDNRFFEVYACQAPGERPSRDEQLAAIVGLAAGALENDPELFTGKGKG